MELAFTDTNGRRLEGPVFDVEHAYPGMPPVVRTVAVRNVGDVAVMWSLGVTVTAAGSDILAEALVVTLRDAAGHRVYQGPLGDLTVAGQRLEVGDIATHTAAIKWPERARDDNVLQGVALGFDLELRAHAAPVQSIR